MFRFRNPRQERIHRRLLLVGRGPASFYRDACYLMAAETPLESTTHVVAHLIREIESALRDVLESVVARSERLAKRGTDAEEGHKAEIRTVLESLNIPETDPVAKAWLALAGKGSQYTLHARAHRSALAPPRPLDQEFQLFWEEVQSILDVVLSSFEKRYLESHRLLDELLARRTPTREDAKTLANRVPNNLVAFGYFFDKLDSPAWLEPLRKEGFFQHPPETERDEEKGTIRFPVWPESSFLAKMAHHAPDKVLEIALQIPKTDNMRVHEDLAEAATRMPGEMVAKLALNEAQWVDRQDRLYAFLPEKLGALICHLAKSRETYPAIVLARSLLAVLPDPRDHKREQSAEEKGYRLPPESRARFEAWDYGEVLRSVLPDLVDAGGLDALSMFCDLLEEAIRPSQRTQNGAPEDYSYVWRPAIENHEQNLDRSVRELLVSGVRDAAERLERNDPTFVRSVVDALEARRWQVFQRIALHILRLFPAAAPGLVQERLVSRTLFDDPGVRHEYYYLAQVGFPQVPETDKQKILGWIEKGPDVEEFKTWYQETRGDQPTEGIVSQYVRHWQRDKLAPISDSLPETWKRAYDEFVGELGSPEHPDFSTYTSGSWVGPTSPKTAEELKSMSVDEVIQFLKSWAAPGGWMSPSPEGLAMQLSDAVKSDPARFAAEATKFQELSRTYVEWLIWGLEEAASGKASFAWLPVLQLCRWVTQQHKAVSTPEGDSSSDEWREARKRVARLLSSGFQPGASEIPCDLRSLAWETLASITRDPDPTPEDEAHDLSLLTGPLTLSINRVRPLALRASLHYGLWVKRHCSSSDAERGDSGLDTVPEVQEVLERHLDPQHDPSLAVRSVYGTSIPNLFLLDRSWLVRSINRIFPLEKTQQNLRTAAWEAYVLMCRAYEDVLEVLQKQYEFAVDCIEAEPGERRSYPEPSHRLAEHLMIFYWLGKLALEEGGVISRFFAKASDELRGHALGFIGRNLHTKATIPPPEILHRLRVLWEWRLAAARASGSPESHAAELSAFGWWFCSAKFDDAWAVTQLTEALRFVAKSLPDHLVVERLRELSARMPTQAVECLSQIVDGDKEGWGILGWREQARTILATALQSNDQGAHQAATGLIHRLGARGHLGFRELLQKETP